MIPFDQTVLRFIQAHCHNTVTDAIFPAVTYLGEGGLFWILLSLLLILLGKKRNWRSTGIVMLSAMLLGLLIGEVTLKNIVCRPRPFMEIAPGPELLIPPPDGYSFPSGHSCASFAAATAIFIRDKRFGAAAFVLAGLIAFSRVFLFVHYPTDVLAGALLGVVCAIVVYITYGRLMEMRRDRSEDTKNT